MDNMIRVATSLRMNNDPCHQVAPKNIHKKNRKTNENKPKKTGTCYHIAKNNETANFFLVNN
jgi:hypothetical protein